MSPAKGLASCGSVGHVYVLQLCSDPGLYKVGRSALGKVNDRFRRLRVGEVLRVIFVGIFNHYCDWERTAHNAFRDQRLPQSEYFMLSQRQTEALVKCLEAGNLELLVGGDLLNTISIRADECCVVIDDSVEKVIIDYSIADDFCMAVEKLQAKAALTPSDAFCEFLS